MPKIFYHATLDTKNTIEEFIPKPPTAIYEYENGTFPRISVSTSIEGCLSGVPWGGRKLENVASTFFTLHDGDVEEEIHLAFKVYEFAVGDIPQENIVSTERLLENGLVMDANGSDEFWIINEPIKPSRSYIVIMKGYNEEPNDVFSQEFYLLTDEDEEDDIDEYIIGCSTKISGIEMEIYHSVDDIPYEIKWDKWEEEKKELEKDNYESDF